MRAITNRTASHNLGVIVPTETKDYTKPNTAASRIPPQSAPLSYRTAIALPESVIEGCAAKANAAGRKLEDWVAARLRACADHDAMRGIYFNDAQRERLEQLLGGVMFADADAVLRLIESRFTLAVGDEKGIQIEDGVYTVLKERAQEMGLSLSEVIRQTVTDGLSDGAYGAH